MRLWLHWLRLGIVWDCIRGRHTPRVADDGIIRCKFCKRGYDL